jgi:hypothetical protein
LLEHYGGKVATKTHQPPLLTSISVRSYHDGNHDFVDVSQSKLTPYIINSIERMNLMNLKRTWVLKANCRGEDHLQPHRAYTCMGNVKILESIGGYGRLEWAEA